MKRIIAILFACLSVNSASAAVYHGIFSGTVGGVSEFAPFNAGDPFTVRFEIDTSSPTPLFVGLDINGFTGTFGNTFVSFNDNESGIQDRFLMSSALDSPVGIFDGYPNSNLSLEFIGGTVVFSGSSLAQPFTYADFNTLSGSMDVNSAMYGASLNISSGAYQAGSLPPVPIPSAVWLFVSGLLGLLGFARRQAGRRSVGQRIKIKGGGGINHNSLRPL